VIYNNFHHAHPENGQFLYFISPTKLEVLGQYLGGTRFDALDGTLKGYYAKHWRPLNEAEHLLVPNIPTKSSKIPKEEKPTKVKTEIKPEKEIPKMAITKSNLF
jgi:hypothetical protein